MGQEKRTASSAPDEDNIVLTIPSDTKHRAPRRAWLAGLSLLTLVAAAPAMAQGNPLTEQPARSGEPPAAANPSAPARGEDTEAQPLAASPSATEIIRSLAPFADGNPNARRAIREIDVEDGKRKVRVDYGRAIDITVFFSYDSARLTAEAKIQLEPLGRALQSRDLLPYRFLIAGHTDAAGDPGYNRNLSLQRALAVRGHLVATYGIDPLRLVVHGWGQTRLKDPANPLSGVNRRVEVALIAPPRRSSWTRPGWGGAPLSGEEASFQLGWRRVAEDCGSGLADPRRIGAFDLDDFGAAPTFVCGDEVLRRIYPAQRFNAWYDPRRRVWSEIEE